MNEPFIMVRRSLFTEREWSERPFTEGQAKIDLLQLAAHSDGVDARGRQQLRGQVHTSQITLAERWGWSRGGVTDFLKRLKEAGGIDFTTDRNKKTGGTFITLHDYPTSNLIDESEQKATSKKQLQHQSVHQSSINGDIKSHRQQAQKKASMPSSIRQQVGDNTRIEELKKTTSLVTAGGFQTSSFNSNGEDTDNLTPEQIAGESVMGRLLDRHGWKPTERDDLLLALRGKYRLEDVTGHRLLSTAKYAKTTAGIRHVRRPIAYILSAVKGDNTPDHGLADAKAEINQELYK